MNALRISINTLGGAFLGLVAGVALNSDLAQLATVYAEAAAELMTRLMICTVIGAVIGTVVGVNHYNRQK